MIKSTFEFEKKRDFGMIISDSLSFFTRNFRSFLLGFLMYIGPFFLIGALGMIYAGMHFPDLTRTEMPGLDMFIGVLVFIPFIIIASIMMIAFVCALAQKYQREPERVLIEGLWPDVRRNLWPTTTAFITLFFIIVVPYCLLILLAFQTGGAVAIALIILLSIPVLFYLSVPMTIFMIAHVLERNTIGTSLRRAFYLVREKWWISFGVFLVVSLLASIASYIFVIPAYIIFIVQILGSLGTGEVSTEFGMWFGIMYACGFLGSLFASMYQTLGMLLQYYNLREQKEGTGLLRRIQEVDKPTGEPFA